MYKKLIEYAILLKTHRISSKQRFREISTFSVRAYASKCGVTHLGKHNHMSVTFHVDSLSQGQSLTETRLTADLILVIGTCLLPMYKLLTFPYSKCVI